MIKSEERDNPSSCWNKAKENELMFVLLERDEAAGKTIAFWCQERIRLGLNTPNDKQIKDAMIYAQMLYSRFE